jgi:hypothetical protein
MLLSLSLIALALVASGSAYAQATRTWVSGVGDDANPCSRTAPCKTFAGAISKTAPGGEIDALDPGGFGALTITKSITIDGGGGQVASVLTAGTAGFVVAAAATDVVIIRNLRFQGLLGGGNGNAGTNGIRFLTGAALVVENCAITGFNTWGIDFEPSATSSLSVINTTLENNGIGNNAVVGAGGIFIAPNGAAANGKAVITNTQAAANLIGFKVIGDNTPNRTTVTINNSQAMNSAKAGFSAETGGGANNGAVAMVLNNVTASGNNTGVVASGGQVGTLLGGSSVTVNTTGISVQNSATIFSYKNNQVNANGTDGSASLTTLGLN